MAVNKNSTVKPRSELLAELDDEVFAIRASVASARAVSGPLELLVEHVKRPVHCDVCHFIGRGVPRMIIAIEASGSRAARLIDQLHACAAGDAAESGPRQTRRTTRRR